MVQIKNFERQALWSMLIDLVVNIIKPWIVMGDFNRLLFIDDKIDRVYITQNDIHDFQ